MISQEKIQNQIDQIASLLSNTIAAKRLQKNTIAEACSISVNTLNNALKSKNVNVSTLLSIADALGMNFIDMGHELEQNYNIEVASVPLESRSAPEIDTVGVRAEAEDTSLEQTSLRMGEPVETVQEAVTS